MCPCISENPLERIQVVGLGQACVDYLGRLTSYPQEDGKVELMDLYMRCGGPASTALVTLSRLGVPTSFLGAVSDDPFGVVFSSSLIYS
jgi:ribokinase